MNVTNPFSKSKSLLRGSKSRKKRADYMFANGVKKIKMDKIKFKSPKAHSLGKKKLRKIKLHGRENKFINNQTINNLTQNSSNINSVRSKGNLYNESKDCKKNVRVVKQEYILNPGEGKLRFTKEVKDKILNRPNLLTKNPLKVLKKISPERQNPIVDPSNFNIPIDRVSQYNNFWKLSGRTKQSSDSGSNVLIRK